MIAAKCKEHNQIGCWCLTDNIFSNSRSDNRKKLTIRENGLSQQKFVTISQEEIDQIPNDMELGSYIRTKLRSNI